MSEPLVYGAGLASGLTLGALFFGGLRWTVRKALDSSQPALWFFGSLMVRTTLVLIGFYGIALCGWQTVGFALVGFTVARLTVTRWSKVQSRFKRLDPGVANHAN